MAPIRRRLAGYVRNTHLLAKGGVSLGSLLLGPLRRRLPDAPNQLDLKRGLSILAPREEPLVHMFKEIWCDRCYAPAAHALSASSTVVDIGANVGVFALWVAASRPGARVISVEPSPRAYEFLERNISRNKLHGIIPVRAACGAQTGETDLYRRGVEAMNTLYCRDSYGSQFRFLARVPMLTLGDLFERFNVQSCDLLKLDCEGAEYEILCNAGTGTLRKIQAIAMEYHVGLNEHTPGQLVTLLESEGFSVEQAPLLDEEGGYLYATRGRVVS